MDNMETKLYSSGAIVSSGLALTGKTIKAGENELLEVSSGGTVIKSVLSSGGTINVLVGGYASHAEICAAGGLHVYSGAYVKEVTVKQNGYLGVGNGAVASYTTIDYAGELRVYGGGYVDNNIINTYGAILLLNGATAVSTTINANGGLHVYSGAKASNTIVNQNGLFGVGLGATVYNTTIGYGGQTIIWGGGRAENSDIGTYGAIILSSGAVADTTIVNSLGGLHVYSGAVAENTVVKQGGFFGVGLGAVTYNTTIDYAGELKVWSGGVVNGNNIDTYGAIILLNGAVASDTTIQALGGLHIYEGATAYNTIISAGATLGIGLGGHLSTAKQKYDAKLIFYDGSILSGKNHFGGTVTVTGNVSANGAEIVFDLSDRSAADGYIIDNIARFTGASFTVASNSVQLPGVYNLAKGAASFSQSITIEQSGASRSLSVGQRVSIGDNVYALNKTNDSLTLTITREEKERVILMKNWVTQYSSSSASNIVISKSGEYDFAEVNGGTLTVTEVGSGGIVSITNGGHASDISITEGGYVEVVQRATADIVDIVSGYCCVSTDGVVSQVTIDAPAALLLENRGRASQVTVSGTLSVTAETVASGVTVASNGKMFVQMRGSADDITVQSGGVVMVDPKGSAANIEIENDGFVHVSAGGSLDSVIVHSGGSLETEVNTTINNIQMDANAAGLNADIGKGTYLNGTSGGVAFNIEDGIASGLDWKGHVVNVSHGIDLFLILKSGGEVKDSVLSAGHILASSGSLVSQTGLHYYAQLNVYSGAVATNNNLDSEAEIYVHGGVIYDTTVNADGYVWVSLSGSAYRTTVNAGGRFDIGSDGGCGGFASGTEVFSSGYFQVLSGTSACQTVVHRGGTMVIDTGVATDTKLSGPGCGLIVKYCGLASNTTIDSSANLLLYRAGVARDIVVNGGYIYVDGDVDSGELNLEKDREKFYSSAKLYQDDAVISNTILNAGAIYLSSGGAASNTTLKTGNLIISSGGKADGVIASAGTISVLNGGMIQNVEITGGYLDLSSKASLVSGYVKGTVGLLIAGGVQASNLNVDESVVVNLTYDRTAELSGKIGDTAYSGTNGVLDNFTLNKGDNLTVLSGASISNLTNNNGFVTLSAGAHGENVNINGSIAGIRVDRTASIDGLLLANGAGATLNGSVSSLQICSSSIAYAGSSAFISGADVSSGASLYGSAGAVLKNTNLGSGATMLIGSAGTADGTIVNNGNVFVQGQRGANAVLYHTTLNAGAIYLSSGGAASNTTLKTGNLIISSGGKADGVIASAGTISVLNGGMIQNVEITGGYLDLSANAAFAGGTVGGSAGILIAGGVQASGLNIEESAVIALVFDGNTKFSGAFEDVSFTGENGVLDNFRINTGDNLSMLSGTTVSNFESDNGFLSLADDAKGIDVKISGTSAGISVGREAGIDGLTLENGAGAAVEGDLTDLRVTTGAHAFVGADSLIIGASVSDNGILVGVAGTVLNNTTVLAGGTVALEEGAVQTGKVVLESGASYQANNARIDFTLTNVSAGNTALIQNQKYLYDGNYTITVSSNQESGKYLLATSCSAMNDPIEMFIGDMEIGSVSLWQDLTYDSKTYSLEMIENNLSLEISDVMADTFSLDPMLACCDPSVSDVPALDFLMACCDSDSISGEENRNISMSEGCLGMTE